MALTQERQLLESINVNNENLTEIIGLVEELITNKVGIERIRNDIFDLGQSKILEQELRVVSELQSSIKRIGLQQLKKLKNPLNERFRGLCEKHEVIATLEFEGLELEIDSYIISELDVLLTEILHDIFESEIIDLRKDELRIKISVEKDDSYTLIQVETNDGRMNNEVVELTELGQEAISLFLQKIGYHNSEQSLMKLCDSFAYTSGSLHFEAEKNKYTRFTISFPIISSILQGMLVTCGSQNYAIPTSLIETIINSSSVSRSTSMNKQMITYREEVIPLLDLAEILEIQGAKQAQSIVIVIVRNQRYGILVDSIIDQSDLVVKSKPPIMKEIKEFSGTTILGDGEVTLVLDIPSIVKGV